MVDRKKIFFSDETGIQIFSRAAYGRSAEGTRAIKRARAIRSRNYSIATAMNSESLFLFEIQDKPYNSEDFTEFLNKLISHLSLNGISGAYMISAFYFESGYLGRSFHALNIQNCDSMSDSLDFLSPEMIKTIQKQVLLSLQSNAFHCFIT
jgi:hypothetical protein